MSKFQLLMNHISIPCLCNLILYQATALDDLEPFIAEAFCCNSTSSHLCECDVDYLFAKTRQSLHLSPLLIPSRNGPVWDTVKQLQEISFPFMSKYRQHKYLLLLRICVSLSWSNVESMCSLGCGRRIIWKKRETTTASLFLDSATCVQGLVEDIRNLLQLRKSFERTLYNDILRCETTMLCSIGFDVLLL